MIAGDGIGMWNIGTLAGGLMAGKTPNLDKLAKEGMLFTDYYAEAIFRQARPTVSLESCRFVPA